MPETPSTTPPSDADDDLIDLLDDEHEAPALRATGNV